MFAVLVGAWYENQPIASDFALYATTLLMGFAVTKLPLERLVRRRPGLQG